MSLHRLEVLRWYTTPGELREIADRLETLWDAANLGDDVPIEVVYHNDSELRITIDQERMFRQRRSP